MSGSVNRTFLIGNLGVDPEVRATGSGKSVCNFRLATSDTWADKITGERKEKTEWHSIVAFGKQGELCGKYLKKGSKVCVEGKLQTREWEDKTGSRRFTTEIVTDRVTFLSPSAQTEQSTSDIPF